MSEAVHETLAFEMTVAAVICVNTATALYSICTEAPPWMERLEAAFLLFFMAEMALRIKHHGRAYFRSAWAWLDTLIIVLSLLPMLGVGVSALRVGRFARLIHIGRHLTGLRVVRLAAMAHWRLTAGRGIKLVIH